MTVGFESAIGSHVGMVRSNNQDSAFAGTYLYLVADGMGGHAGGDVASALATKTMAPLDVEPTDTTRATAESLRKAVLGANRKLRETVGDRPELAGMGTTFTGFVTVGDQLALAHIGDSRLYLLRDDTLTQVTRDHTFVQRLVDSGKITEEEAKTHPRRSVLMRVLGDVDSSPDIDSDVLDPAYAPGTGTPEMGGLHSRELLRLLRGLNGLNIVGADVVEVAPAYDHADTTALAAATLVFDYMALLTQD